MKYWFAYWGFRIDRITIAWWDCWDKKLIFEFVLYKKDRDSHKFIFQLGI